MQVGIYVSGMALEMQQIDHYDWMARIDPTAQNIQSVGNAKSGAALLLEKDNLVQLRFGMSGRDSAERISALEDLARQKGAQVMRTQGKVARSGILAQLLLRSGFDVQEQPSVIFQIAPKPAIQRLDPMRQALRERAPNVVHGTPDVVLAVAHILAQNDLMDEFELLARLDHQGIGGISLEECAFVYDADGLAGFILIGQREQPMMRELKVRWVAERCRRNSFVNLALLLHYLNRAVQAGVTQAYFSANLGRHTDTLKLATLLGATRCGETIALTRDLS